MDFAWGYALFCLHIPRNKCANIAKRLDVTAKMSYNADVLMGDGTRQKRSPQKV